MARVTNIRIQELIDLLKEKTDITEFCDVEVDERNNTIRIIAIVIEEPPRWKWDDLEKLLD